MAADDWDADDFEVPAIKDTRILPSSKERAWEVGSVDKALSEPEVNGAKLEAIGPPDKPAGRKQRLKAALKEADMKVSHNREDKVGSLQELMGISTSKAMNGGKAGGWLDPHCKESDFERSSS